MAQRPAWAPDDVDLELPAAARMYDHHLGGSHNFEADRALAEQNMGVWPDPDAALTDPLGGDVKRYSGYAAVGRRP